MVRSKRSLDKAFSPNKGKGMPKPQRGAACAEKSASMQVVVRVRPPSAKEIDSNARKIIEVVNEQGLIFDPKETDDLFFYHGSKQINRDVTKRKNKNSEFVFDRVFDETSSNQDLYQYCTKDIMKALFDGYNCSVFAYGATGSGKTFTMLGNKESPGIAYQTMVELYQKVDELSEEYDFDVRVSYLEVYNENVRDLLQPDSKHLHLREDSATGVTIVNLTISKIASAEELFARLTQGNVNRTQHPTDSNAESSRSHAVFQTYIHSRVKKTKQQKLVKLSMIDLAGSEKASATGGRGARFAEGQNINRSLLALGNCINSLAGGSKHVPYRDSKLTRLLKDSLGGNCKTVMIANISPCSNAYEDTHRTLKYAERAKMIKLKIAKNIVANDFTRLQYNKLVETLQNENAALKQELAELRNQLKLSEEQLSKKNGEEAAVKMEPAEDNDMQTEDIRANECAESAVPVVPTAAAENVDQTVGLFPKPNEIVEKCDVDLLPQPMTEIVEKCDKDVQVFIPPTKCESENKLLSDFSSLFARQKGLYQKVSSDERNLKRIQRKCYRRLVATRRLNVLGNDHKELEKRESRMRGAVEMALRQAKEYHGSLTENWRKLQAEHTREANMLTCAQLACDEDVVNFVAKSQLELKIRTAEFQAEHMKELLKVLRSQNENDDAIIMTLCRTLKSHHTLLKAYGKVTDTMTREYNDSLKMLEGDKMVKFVDAKEAGDDDDKDQLTCMSSLLWESECLWGYRDGSLPSARFDPSACFDQWLGQMTNLLKEVEQNSARRESLACGYVPVKLDTTFCKDTHDLPGDDDVLNSTFVVPLAAGEVADVAQPEEEALRPAKTPPACQPSSLLPAKTPPTRRPSPLLPAHSFGFKTAANEFVALGGISEQNKENATVFKKPVATPRKVMKKQLKYSDPSHSNLFSKKSVQNTGIRMPLKMRGQSSLGLKLPTSKQVTALPRFHPYRGPETMPRTRSSKPLKKSSF